MKNPKISLFIDVVETICDGGRAVRWTDEDGSYIEVVLTADGSLRIRSCPEGLTIEPLVSNEIFIRMREPKI